MTHNTENFSDLHKEFLSSRKVPADFLSLHKDSLSNFIEQGIPTRKDEEWRYTNFSKVAGVDFTLNSSNKISQKAQDYINRFQNHLVLINGIYSQELSQTPDFKTLKIDLVTDLIANNDKELIELLNNKKNNDAFSNLNQAFINQGIRITAEKDSISEETLHIVHITETKDSLYTNPFVWIQLESFSKMRVLESYISFDENTAFTNAHTEISASEASHLDHTVIQAQSKKSFHINSVNIRQNAVSHVNTFAFSLGALTSRSNLTIEHRGKGAHTDLNGLYTVKGKQHVDHHTTVDHKVPHTTSAQLYKGILDDDAHAVFNGKVFVRKDAQKIDANQLNKNMLLSKKAVVDTKPQLEISADDVTCAHGATIGQINKEEIFYFLSRGIPENEARQFLVHGFAGDVLEKIDNIAERELLISLLNERFFT